MASRQISSLLVGLTMCSLLASCGSTGTTTRAPIKTSNTTASASSSTEPVTTQLGDTSIDHAAWKGLGYRWAWAGYPKVTRGASIVEMKVYGDRVVTRDSATVVSVLNSSTGRMVWGTEIGRPETKVLGVVRDRDRLLASTETELHEIAIESGNLLKRSPFGKLINTEPLLVGDLAIYGTFDGELLAMNRTLGLPAWRYGVGGVVAATPTLLNPDTIAAVTQDGHVTTIDLDGPSARTTEMISGGVENNPVTDQFYLVVASLDRSVYGFRDGKRIWRYRTSEQVKVQPVIYRDKVYFATPNLGVVCLDINTGDKLWSQPALPNGWIVGINDGELIAWTGVVMAAVDPENGDIIASAEFQGLSGVRTDRFENGNIYAVAGRGTVLRFDPR